AQRSVSRLAASKVRDRPRALSTARGHLIKALELSEVVEGVALGEILELRRELIRLSVMLEEHTQVIAYVEEMLGVLDGLDDGEAWRSMRAEIHLDAAESSELLVRPEDCRRHLDQATLWIEHPPQSHEACRLAGRLRFLEGKLAFGTAHLSQAARWHEEATPYLERSGAQALQAQNLLQLSKVLNRHNRSEDAMEVCLQAQQLSHALGDRAGEARAWELMGTYHVFQWDGALAQPCFEKAAQLHHKTGNGLGAARMSFESGRVLGIHGPIDQALAQMLTSLKAIERYGKRRNHWSYARPITQANLFLCNFDEVSRWMRWFLKQVKQGQLGKWVYISLYAYEAHYAQQQGYVNVTQRAIAQMRDRLDPNNQLSKNRLWSSYLHELAMLRNIGEYEAAEETYQRCWAIQYKGDDTAYVYFLLLERASLLYSMGRFDEIEPTLRQIPPEFTEMFCDGQSMLNVHWGKLRFWQGRHREACVHIEEAIAHCTARVHRSLLVRLYSLRSLIAHDLGEDPEPWLEPIRSIVSGKTINTTCDIGQALFNLLTVMPDAVPVTLRDGREAKPDWGDTSDLG
ncbi:MAG: hypothetical protein AAFX99_16190, partial [Myxococcota bacterium]